MNRHDPNARPLFQVASLFADRGEVGGLLAAMLLVSLPSPGPLAAQDDFGRNGWEIGVLAGSFNDEAEFGPSDRAVQVERGTVLGAHVGRVFPSNFFLQADLGYSPDLHWVGETFFTESDPAEFRDMRSLTVGLGAGYNIQPADRLQVFGLVGAGMIRWSVDDLGSQSQFTSVLGGGGRLFLTRSLALRAKMSWRYTADAMSALREQEGVPGDSDGMWTIEPSAGISLFLGGEDDSDADGVPDRADDCPDTPVGAVVDTAGCPSDSDGDGVLDGLDACPSTPAGARVDTEGCALDSDADGVADGLDECPNTPDAAIVDETGCPLDSDGDGVADGLDRCPNTPAGVEVDENGCALDGDGDGVPNGRDECPNTAPATEVDATGCPLNVIQRELEETGRVVLHGVYFDFDRATLRPESRMSLDQAGEALVRNPSLRVQIQGHTDAIGTDAYNLQLSDARAQAVYRYLSDNFAELNVERLSAHGYGESEPVATNQTAEGRQENRRVEFRVLTD